jgi:hypothetical protein
MRRIELFEEFWSEGVRRAQMTEDRVFQKKRLQARRAQDFPVVVRVHFYSGATRVIGNFRDFIKPVAEIGTCEDTNRATMSASRILFIAQVED